MEDKNVHHTNEPGSCEGWQLEGDTEERSMPSTITSSPARASHACPQTMEVADEAR
jgi:hypothetical protein